MALTRADSFTNLKKKQEYFSDFLNSFAKTPIGDQLGRVTNEQSVNQSLRNLIKTNLGERLFQPRVGSDVYASMFEPNDILLVETLKFNIENTIKINESRVNLLSVDVTSVVNQLTKASKNIGMDENTVTIKIVYTLINNPEPITLTTTLKRIR
jgi:phage baseplate assembly protein W